MSCITVEVAKLSLKPGDALLIRLPASYGAKEAGRAVDCARAALGSKVPILVAPIDIEFSVISEGEKVP